MGGGGTETKTESTAPNNPMVDSTTTKLLGSLQSQMDNGTAVFGQSLQPGAGQTTKDGWASMLSGANNPAYSAGVAGATSDFADAAAGNQFGANDAYYKQLGDDTLRDVNAMFTTSGRFGSGSHVDTATTALGNVNNANIAADRAWQMQAARNAAKRERSYCLAAAKRSAGRRHHAKRQHRASNPIVAKFEITTPGGQKLEVTATNANSANASLEEFLSSQGAPAQASAMQCPR